MFGKCRHEKFSEVFDITIWKVPRFFSSLMVVVGLWVTPNRWWTVEFLSSLLQLTASSSSSSLVLSCLAWSSWSPLNLMVLLALARLLESSPLSSSTDRQLSRGFVQIGMCWKRLAVVIQSERNLPRDSNNRFNTKPQIGKREKWLAEMNIPLVYPFLLQNCFILFLLLILYFCMFNEHVLWRVGD